MEKEIDFTEVHQICAAHQIEIKALKAINGSFDQYLRQNILNEKGQIE